MKMKTFFLVVFLCAYGFTLRAIEQPQLDAINQQLHDSNSQVRIKAIERLATSSPEVNGNEALPLFVTALSDSDVNVRNFAATGLEVIAFLTMPKMAPLKPGATDIRSYQPVQSALLAAIDDVNEATRKSAIAAYLFSFPVQADLQDKLVDRFDVEQKNPVLQRVMILALTMDGVPTPKAISLLDRLISSPATNYWVAQVVSDSVNPPVMLLPKLVNQISITSDSNKKSAIVRAISKYGARAKPYLRQIEEAKTNETDPSAKQSMQGALKVISEAQ